MKKTLRHILLFFPAVFLVLPLFVSAALPVEPTVTLTANPNPVNTESESIFSGITTLTWSSTYADSCDVTQGKEFGFDTGGATSGSDNSNPLSAETTFAVSCTGFGGTAEASVSVDVVNDDGDTDPPETVPLSGSCSANRTTATTEQSVTWTAVPTGGNGVYTYAWSGTNGLSGSSVSVSKTYTTTGTKTASVVITSNKESVTKNCSNSVVVSAPGGGDDDDDDDSTGGGGTSVRDELIKAVLTELINVLRQLIALILEQRGL